MAATGTVARLVDHALDRVRPAATTAELTGRILAALRLPDGGPDALRCAELVAGGLPAAYRLLCRALRRHGVVSPGRTRMVARAVAAEVVRWEVRLTGAEVAAVLLAAAGVSRVFAYPGTSELALCDAVGRAGGLRLTNGRGDKESAFMAAGASLLGPNRGAAILHGARGLTNAAGGVADARRNEAGAMFLVGLPSSGSARFLPPHAETDLFAGMGTFADWAWEAPGVPEDPDERAAAALRFVAALRDGLARVAQPPHRPALFGIPQDVAEQSWIALDEMLPVRHEDPVPQAAGGTGAAGRAHAVAAAVQRLREARRPVFLVDDYALRYPGLRVALDRLSRCAGAPVLQLRYRRGPMLFERLQPDEVSNFVGWLNQYCAVHTGLLDACDLLVTVEDRNMYERVVGRLPAGRKIAVNSDPSKALKNEYLSPADVLLAGDPARVLADMAEQWVRVEDSARAPWFPEGARAAGQVTPEPPSTRVAYGRRAVARALAGVLRGWHRPVLVDDSQMFGGLLAEHYDDLPAGLRVFGGHGGFVGGGLAYATGLALAHEDVRVMCTLGDQAFTNSFQGLVAAIQERARVLFVVCNNGGSVSLRKQAATSLGASGRAYLSNVDELRYGAVAEALGIPHARVEVPVGAPPADVDACLSRLSDHLAELSRVPGPSQIELVLPGDHEAWRGIWLTQGFEQQPSSAMAGERTPAELAASGARR